MIIICEPICKGISHEKVNSGFIYGLRLAFPDEKIRVYAAATHIMAIKDILKHDNIFISDIEYRALYFVGSSSVLSIINYAFSFFRMFSEVIALNQLRVFFLSFSPEMLYIVKVVKRFSKFSQLKFAIVLHGAFENIADDLPLASAISLVRNSLPNSKENGILRRLRRTNIKAIPKKIIRFMASKIPVFPEFDFIKEFFSVKCIMEWRHSADFRYVTLSPHILLNAEKFIDLNKFDFYTVVLPTNFVDVTDPPDNEFVKFAIFGYGNSLVLHNIAYALEKKNIVNKYEIRVIGMDNRGTEEFANVSCPCPGRVLLRNEMEKYAVDIDIFLILYDKTKYRLSCSGSILESMSMVKPVVHFDNDCINEFNKTTLPIGFRCYSFDEYVDKLADIIENYAAYRLTLTEYRENILKQREMLSIQKSAPLLRKLFWG